MRRTSKQDLALASLCFLVCVALPPERSTYAPRWAILAVCVPALLLFFPPQLPRRAACLLTTFLAYAVLSCWWSPSAINSADYLIHFLILGLAIALGSALSSLMPAFVGFCCGLAVNAIVAALQWLDLTSIPYSSNLPAGLLLNKNTLAELAAPVLAWALLSRRSWFASLPAAALLLAPDRTAIVALLIVGSLWSMRHLRAAFIFDAVALTAVSTVALVAWHPDTLQVRLDIWTSLLSDLTLQGHGLAALFTLRPTIEYAHSDPLQLLYELGVGALPLAVLLILALRGPLDPPRLTLIALLVESLASYVLYIPTTGLLGALLVGHLLRPWPSLPLGRLQR